MIVGSGSRQEMVAVLRRVRELVTVPGSDFTWSSWENVAEATAELDGCIAALERGGLPERLELSVLFAPTGPLQELSVSNGWGEEFLALAERFDAAEAGLYEGAH